MKAIVSATAVLCLLGGVVVVASNPRRFANQVFAFMSLLAALWLSTVAGAIHAGERYWTDPSINPLPWIRANGIVSALLMWGGWLLHESIVCNTPGLAVRRSLWALVACCAFVAIAHTEFYAPSEGVPGNFTHGVGYYIFVVFVLVSSCCLFARALRDSKRHTGIRKIEIQFLSLNQVATLLLVAIVVVAGYMLQANALRRSASFVFLAGYAVATWAIILHRLLDARQIGLLLAQRVVLLAMVAAGVLAGQQILGTVLVGPVGFVLSLALFGAVALRLDKKTRDWLRLGPKRVVGELREATIALAKSEPAWERLVVSFEELLRASFQSSSANLIFCREQPHGAHRSTLSIDRVAMEKVGELNWITPEGIERQGGSSGLDALRRFLADNNLGAVVAVPRGSSAPSMLVALGFKRSGWLFTNHDLECLQAIAEFMDGVLAHSRLTEQTALRAKMDHLTMMSHGLAHDLKNLITPISSYLVHTKGRGEPGSDETEVHAAAQRSVNVMTDYIRQAAFFANELTPHWQSVGLRRVAEAVQEQTAAAARRRDVLLEIEVMDLSLVADGVLLQRLLANLVFNAIDATRAGDRIVVSGEPAAPAWVRLQVIDEGCGIPTENLTRVFEPYFTTKEFGEEVRGFGLGLSICRKIVQLHGGTIAVESALDRGTTFTVHLPRSQSSAASMPPTPGAWTELRDLSPTPGEPKPIRVRV